MSFDKRSWTYGYCECCMKNSHKNVKMVKKKIRMGNPNDKRVIEMWMCPECGASKVL